MSRFQVGDKVDCGRNLTGNVIEVFPKGRVLALVESSYGTLNEPYPHIFFDSDATYFKIECGPGWRFLSPMEASFLDDQMWCGGRWNEVNTKYPGVRSHLALRRRT